MKRKEKPCQCFIQGVQESLWVRFSSNERCVDSTSPPGSNVNLHPGVSYQKQEHIPFKLAMGEEVVLHFFSRNHWPSKGIRELGAQHSACLRKGTQTLWGPNRSSPFETEIPKPKDAIVYPNAIQPTHEAASHLSLLNKPVCIHLLLSFWNNSSSTSPSR